MILIINFIKKKYKSIVVLKLKVLQVNVIGLEYFSEMLKDLIHQSSFPYFLSYSSANCHTNLKNWNWC